MNDAQSRQSSQMGLVFAAGLFAGYVASLIMPENAQDEAKEKLTKSAQQLKDTVTDPKNMGKVKSLLNGKSIDLMSLYMEVRNGIMDEISNSKETWDDINKRKYSELLKKALQRLTDEQSVPEEQLETLKGYLEKDYEAFRSSKKAN